MRRLTIDKLMVLHAAYRCVRMLRSQGVDLTPREVLAYWDGYAPRPIGKRSKRTEPRP